MIKRLGATYKAFPNLAKYAETMKVRAWREVGFSLLHPFQLLSFTPHGLLTLSRTLPAGSPIHRKDVPAALGHQPEPNLPD